MERVLQRRRCLGHRLYDRIETFDVLRVKFHLASDEQRCCKTSAVGAHNTLFVLVLVEQGDVHIAPSGFAFQTASVHLQEGRCNMVSTLANFMR